MIWDFIRDFFVQYIFGGFDSLNNPYGGYVGTIFSSGGDPLESTTFTVSFGVGDIYHDVFGETLTAYITLGDWLSTTATIICMVLISICFILLVRWIFKAVASAFLLK